MTDDNDQRQSERLNTAWGAAVHGALCDDADGDAERVALCRLQAAASTDDPAPEFLADLHRSLLDQLPDERPAASRVRLGAPEGRDRR